MHQGWDLWSVLQAGGVHVFFFWSSWVCKVWKLTSHQSTTYALEMILPAQRNCVVNCLGFFSFFFISYFFDRRSSLGHDSCCSCVSHKITVFWPQTGAVWTKNINLMKKTTWFLTITADTYIFHWFIVTRKKIIYQRSKCNVWIY